MLLNCKLRPQGLQDKALKISCTFSYYRAALDPVRECGIPLHVAVHSTGSYRSRGCPCASASRAAPPAPRVYRTPTHDVHALSSETFAFYRLPHLLVETDKSNHLSHILVLDGLQCYVIGDVCRTRSPTRAQVDDTRTPLGRYLWRIARR